MKEMKLTGKCKEDFDMWLIRHYDDKANLFRLAAGEFHCERFDEFPESMKFGVYQDFFDSLINREDIICRICILLIEMQRGFSYTINGSIGKTHKSRQEARTAAINQANEIYNKL